LNLPELDAYNTQSAIALLRQQMEYGHVYDMTKLAQNPLKNISKTQVRAHSARGVLWDWPGQGPLGPEERPFD
jgi:hypothetical protein